MWHKGLFIYYVIICSLIGSTPSPPLYSDFVINLCNKRNDLFTPFLLKWLRNIWTALKVWVRYGLVYSKNYCLYIYYHKKWCWSQSINAKNCRLKSIAFFFCRTYSVGIRICRSKSKLEGKLIFYCRTFSIPLEKDSRTFSIALFFCRSFSNMSIFCRPYSIMGRFTVGHCPTSIIRSFSNLLIRTKYVFPCFPLNPPCNLFLVLLYSCCNFPNILGCRVKKICALLLEIVAKFTTFLQFSRELLDQSISKSYCAFFGP